MPTALVGCTVHRPIHRTTEHYTHIWWCALYDPTRQHRPRPTYCECESTYVLDSLTRVGIRSISSLLFPY